MNINWLILNLTPYVRAIRYVSEKTIQQDKAIALIVAAALIIYIIIGTIIFGDKIPIITIICLALNTIILSLYRFTVGIALLTITSLVVSYLHTVSMIQMLVFQSITIAVMLITGRIIETNRSWNYTDRMTPLSVVVIKASDLVTYVGIWLLTGLYNPYLQNVMPSQLMFLLLVFLNHIAPAGVLLYSLILVIYYLTFWKFSLGGLVISIVLCLIGLLRKVHVEVGNDMDRLDTDPMSKLIKAGLW